MKKILSLLVGILMLGAAPINVLASHAMGGELTYTWLQGNDYRLQYSFYRDCAGISAPLSFPVTVSSSCDTTLTYTLTATAGSPQTLDILCPGFVSTCNGGTMNGIEKWTYQGIVTLSGPCADWKFVVEECCRNMAVTNLAQAPSEFMWLEATLDNFNVAFNSSPRFASDPVPYLYVNNLNNFNVGVADPDNDSIVVSLADALGTAGVACQYAPGFSGSNPVTTSGGIAIDPATGNISFTPSQVEVDVIAVQIDEYRGGILIGSCRRDFQATIVNTPNHLPSLSGINGTNQYTLNACAGDTLSFTISSSDIDPNDSTFIIATGGDLSAIASLTNFGTQNDSITVDLIVDGSLISPVAHRLLLNVRDNACPYYGNQTYCVNLYVSGCSQNIWPGDANNDLRCDLYDILPIGLGNGATGPIRTNASIAWTAQTANDWSQSFLTGVNYKFADCNGDGTIDLSDTLAIAQNYGQSHPARLSNPTVTQSTSGSLYLIASTSTASPNDQLTIDVNLGDANAAANNVYGVAFRLVFNPTIIDPLTSRFRFLPSQLGTPGVDLLTFVHTDWSAGIVDAVAVRLDGQEQSIDSTIAVFDVVIVDNVSARTVLGFDLVGVRGIRSSGIPQYYDVVNDSVNVNSGTTGILQPSGLAPTVFPNPAKGTIRWTGIENVNGVVLRDLRGRKLIETDAGWSGNQIDVSNIPVGTYLIELSNGNQLIRKKISVIR